MLVIDKSVKLNKTHCKEDWSLKGKNKKLNLFLVLCNLNNLSISVIIHLRTYDLKKLKWNLNKIKGSNKFKTDENWNEDIYVLGSTDKGNQIFLI